MYMRVYIINIYNACLHVLASNKFAFGELSSCFVYVVCITPGVFNDDAIESARTY